VSREDAQLVIVDTPGLHRPRTLLGERLNSLVRDTWTEVDVVAVCLPANQHIGPGDTFIVNAVAQLPQRPKLVALATKSDLVSKVRLRNHLQDIQNLEESTGIRWEHIVPVSAVTGEQVDLVCDLLCTLLPEGPALFPEDIVTDEPTEMRIAELIRESVLEGVRDELPHSITVIIDEMRLREGRPENKPLMEIFASMIVERDSQKGILIGYQGSRLKDVGSAARAQITALLGMPVHLDLHIKVLKEWQRDPKHLNRLGF